MDAPPGLDPLGKFVSQREAAALRGRLGPDEEVRYAVDGLHGKWRGLLAATGDRVLFVAKGLLRTYVRQWDYDDIGHVEVQAGRDGATLTLHGDAPFALQGCTKAAALGFQDAVRLSIPQRTFRRVRLVRDARLADRAPEGDSVYERLQRLERMRQRKSITEPEYKVNRRRILEEAGLPTDLQLKALTRPK